jgi:uncharacterized protein involved in response to NO
MVADARGAAWRAEPFRLFFPLGVVLGAVGVGHWLLYASGVTATYSCQLHGLLQMQASALQVLFNGGFGLLAFAVATHVSLAHLGLTDHLGWAAAAWIAGSAVWLAFLGPRLLRPRA